MRYIKYVFLAAVAAVLIFSALANRGAVVLRLVPEGLEGWVPFSTAISMPLFVVIFGGVVAGLLIGFVWEWLREMKHRSAVRKEHKQVVRLERELDRMKAAQKTDKDEVLALLEDSK